jgi:epoxide hydrolase 4
VPVLRTELQFTQRTINGVRLHVAEAGPADGRLVVLLHGFPEFWYGWRHQIDALAQSGYRLLIPDQRGYNLSDRPQAVAAYDLDLLAGDVLGLVEASGRRSFCLVGHDWGAAVGWWIAARDDGRLERFAALSAPHPAIWAEAIRNEREQRRRSWYISAFRLPWLPELLMRQRNFKALADALREAKRPEACSDADLDAYRVAWSQPGALTGMVNWYRAIPRRRATPESDPRIRAPTLVIWGTGDKFAIRDLAERSARLRRLSRRLALGAA